MERGRALLPVRVIPRASRVALSWEGDAVCVRLTAPPVKGAANEALIALLAERLRLPSHAITLAHGAGSRHKLLAVEGLDADELWRRLRL